MGQSSSSTDILSPIHSNVDYLPDDCLATIFQFLSSTDRKNISLVSHRWLLVEAQSRHRLSLNAQSSLLPLIPSLFSRFHSLTNLSLRSHRKSNSINDDALILISLKCPNLSRLKLRACRNLTHTGLSAFAQNTKSLKKFSTEYCTFGSQGINAILHNSPSLEHLSVKQLRGINTNDQITPGVASLSLKSLCLKELYNGQCFQPVITGSNNLRSLKLLRCLGDWDKVLENVTNSLYEIHLERVQVSDIGLSAISNCSGLEILRVVKAPECTDFGVGVMAERCKLLRKVHIDSWRTDRIGDKGLVAIAKHSVNLEELVIIGIHCNYVSLEAIGVGCKKLARLGVCSSETIGDVEISSIASKCSALKKLCIKGCAVSDKGMEAFAQGCPNLVKIKVKKCKGVTSGVLDWLRVRRGALVVDLDVFGVESEVADGSASDCGAPEETIEFPSRMGQVNVNAGASSSSNGISRFGFLRGRNLVANSWRRWSNAISS